MQKFIDIIRSILKIKELKNKILGGWTGKSYGAMMGQPMEFAAQGEIYQGSLDIWTRCGRV